MVSAQFLLSVIQTSATFAWVLIASKNTSLQSHPGKQKQCSYITQSISMEGDVFVHFLLFFGRKLNSGETSPRDLPEDPSVL